MFKQPQKGRSSGSRATSRKHEQPIPGGGSRPGGQRLPGPRAGAPLTGPGPAMAAGLLRAAHSGSCGGRGAHGHSRGQAGPRRLRAGAAPRRGLSVCGPAREAVPELRRSPAAGRGSLSPPREQRGRGNLSPARARSPCALPSPFPEPPFPARAALVRCPERGRGEGGHCLQSFLPSFLPSVPPCAGTAPRAGEVPRGSLRALFPQPGPHQRSLFPRRYRPIRAPHARHPLEPSAGHGGLPQGWLHPHTAELGPPAAAILCCACPSPFLPVIRT